jgi:hypothetical protein
MHPCKDCGVLCVVEYSTYQCDFSCGVRTTKPDGWYRLSLGMCRYDGSDWPYGIIRNVHFCSVEHMNYYIQSLTTDTALISTVNEQAEIDALRKKITLLEAQIELHKPVVVVTELTKKEESQ